MILWCQDRSYAETGCEQLHRGKVCTDSNGGNDMKKKEMKSSKGFTLVELIVVLVILAILAAILVPALLGYIDRAREKQDMINARNCLTAAQAEFTKNYAQGTDSDVCAVSGVTTTNGNYGDVFLKQDHKFSKKVFETADDTPDMFICGCGEYKYTKKSVKSDAHKAYTVYFAVYWRDVNHSDPIFFDGTNWRSDYPWKKDGANTFNIGGENIKLQFYILSSPYANNNDTWNKLKAKVKVK